MTGRRRGPVPRVEASPNFCMCCLACGFHRWDCTKVEPKYRADGPYLPTDDRRSDIEPVIARASLRDAVASIERALRSGVAQNTNEE